MPSASYLFSPCLYLRLRSLASVTTDIDILSFTVCFCLHLFTFNTGKLFSSSCSRLYLGVPAFLAPSGLLWRIILHFQYLIFLMHLSLDKLSTFQIAKHNSLFLQPFIGRFSKFSMWYLSLEFLTHVTLRGKVDTFMPICHPGGPRTSFHLASTLDLFSMGNLPLTPPHNQCTSSPQLH